MQVVQRNITEGLYIISDVYFALLGKAIQNFSGMSADPNVVVSYLWDGLKYVKNDMLFCSIPTSIDTPSVLSLPISLIRQVCHSQFSTESLVHGFFMKIQLSTG